MFNLLLVDDEPTILDGLSNNIDWEELDIQEVFKARDSNKALDILNNHRVDIIITDICMPGISGLEMSAAIKVRWPHAKIIFLSGYKEFEYAKKAVELGVCSYLIKPVSYEDIVETVRSTICAMEEELNKVRVLEDARKKMAAAASVLQERFLISWIVYGRSNPSRDIQEVKDCGLQISPAGYGFLFIIKIDEWNGEPLDPNFMVVAFKDLAKEIFSKHISFISFIDREENTVMLVENRDKQMIEESFKCVKSMLDAFQLSIKKTLGCIVSIFWCDIFLVPDLHSAYKDTVSAINKRTIYDTGAIMGPQIEAKTTSRLVDSIKAFIESRFEKGLSVTMIADYYNYNASYLTRIFKRETGFSMNEYMIKVRMEKAKELLKQPGAKVSEISLLVGYENVPHFSRLFKKWYGMGPKEYQSL